MTLLRVEKLSIAFGGIDALSGVSFSMERRAIQSLIGPNGAGKSTLFNCITGIYRPDEGSATLEDTPLLGVRPHRICELGIARTFQNIELFGYLTVLENVLLGRHRHMRTGPLRAWFFTKGAREEEVAQRMKAEELLDFLELQPFRDRLVGQLPYGTRKKVEIARALACEPQLLLLDEPSAGMTAEEKEEMVHVVRDVRDELGISVLLVEHDMGLVMGISDRVVVLDHGQRIAEGTPDEVTKDPEVIRAYLGSNDG